MLLSIAVLPLALPHLWEKHFGKIAAFWGLAFLTPCLLVYGFNVALYEFLHIILLDYIPFLVLLFTLFTVAGGVRLTGSLVGTPGVNTGLLAVGTVLVLYPAGFLAAAGVTALAIATVGVRIERSHMLVLLGLLGYGLSWMQWNLMVISGTVQPGIWFNASFTVSALVLGWVRAGCGLPCRQMRPTAASATRS